MRVSRSNGEDRISPEHRDADFERLRKERDELRAREQKARAEAREAKERLASLVSTSKTFASSMRDRAEERRRSRRRLAAQHAITRVLAEANDLEEAAPMIFKTLGDGFGWALGVLWSADEETGTWRCDEFWRSPSVSAGAFEAACRQATFRRGDELPGRVWERGGPVWVEDILANEGFLRAEAAAEDGLHAALAFPIESRDLSEVFEFFGREALLPDEDLLLLATIIGGQIGQFVERRRAEEALRRSEERHRSLITAASSIVWTAAVGGECVEEMPSWQRFTGQTPARYKGFGWLDAVHPEDRLAAGDWKGLLKNKAPIEAGYRLLRHDGQYRRVVSRGVPILDARGEVREWIGTVTDVEDERRAEEALQASEERFRGIFNQTISGVAQTDLTGRFVLVNRRYCEITGYTREELLNLRMQDITHPDDLPENVELFERMVREGEGFTIEKRYVRKDGSIVWVRNAVSAARDRSDEPIYAIAVVEDITKHKRAEEEREHFLARQWTARAEASERRRISRELHDRVAHSMGVVHQSIELYKAFLPRDPSRAEVKLALAQDMAKTALDSTRDLSMALREPVADGGLEDMLSSFLESSVPPDVETKLSVRGDESSIPTRAREQLFLILREAARNAVSHSKCGRLRVRLDVTAKEFVGLVEDDGRGFDPEGLANGSGLRSMKERATLEGGAFDVHSEPSGGTRVRVSIPLAPGR